jgi:hypothetical protein
MRRIAVALALVVAAVGTVVNIARADDGEDCGCMPDPAPAVVSSARAG